MANLSQILILESQMRLERERSWQAVELNRNK